MTQVFRVIGPPGSGKTRYLSDQARRAAEVHGIHAVAICSLTNTAAEAIAARTSLPPKNVATLHSHCLRSLGTPALAESPEVVKAFNDRHPGHRRSVKTNRADVGSGATSADRHHEHAGALRSAMTPIERWPAAVRLYHQAWTTFKETEALLDFTDLIEQSATNGLYGAPRVLLVDEAQDLSRLELQVIKATSRRMHTTVLAGDPAQALYAFRGADPLALGSLPVDGERVLSTSWRCGQAIIDRARTLLRRYQPALDVDYHARDGNPGMVQRSRAAADNPTATVAEIRRRLEHGTVMVVGTCAHHLTPVAAELKAAGIAFHNPYRPDAPQWNPMLRAGPLQALTRIDERTWGEDARWWTWGDVAAWSEPLVKRTMGRGGWDLIDHKVAKDQFGVTSAGEEADPDTLADILGGLDHPLFTADMDGQVQWWRSQLRKPAAAGLPVKVWAADRPGLLAESRVILGTAHSVKGGEADTVIVLPDASRSAWWQQDRGSVARSLYVAMTRARSLLLLGQASTVEAMVL